MKLSEMKKLDESASYTIEHIFKPKTRNYLLIDVIFTNLQYTCTKDGEELSECPFKLPSVARIRTYVNKEIYDENDFFGYIGDVLAKNLSFMTSEFSVELTNYDCKYYKKPISVSEWKDWDIYCNVDVTKELINYFSKK